MPSMTSRLWRGRRTARSGHLAIEELRAALEQSNAAQEGLREQAEDYRRRSQRLESEAREARLTALSILDALDDLAAVARQKNGPQWTSRDRGVEGGPRAVQCCAGRAPGAGGGLSPALPAPRI